MSGYFFYSGKSLVFMDREKTESLWLGCAFGDLGRVKAAANDPSVDVNWSDHQHGGTPFYRACGNGKADVVEYLMSHPLVDVTKTTNARASPFLIACQGGFLEVVSLLLTDPRIDPNVTSYDNNSSTPLFVAARSGRLDIVQVLLSSDWAIYTMPAARFRHLPSRTAAEQGRPVSQIDRFWGESSEDYFRRCAGGPLCDDLIDTYERDPVKTRTMLRSTQGVREPYIGRLYALAVFYSDGFVAMSKTTKSGNIARFFAICARLSLDLQMILCNRAFGSPKDGVLSKFSELAFRWLSRPATFDPFFGCHSNK